MPKLEDSIGSIVYIQRWDNVAKPGTLLMIHDGKCVIAVKGADLGRDAVEVFKSEHVFVDEVDALTRAQVDQAEKLKKTFQEAQELNTRLAKALESRLTKKAEEAPHPDKGRLPNGEIA